MNKFVLALLFLFNSGQGLAEDPPKEKLQTKKWQETKYIDGKKVRVLKNSTPITTTIDIPPLREELKTCEVEISTDYWQESQNLKVETLVENTECAASHGGYTVDVRTQDVKGEIHNAKYEETWSRDNNQPIKTTHSYSMKGDSELLKVRLTTPFNNACVCDGPVN